MEIYYSNHISWQLLDNKVYIIDEITLKIYSLQDVAKDFWILIKDNHSFKKIINILSERYNISNDILISDMNEFRDSLVSEKLLVKGDCCYE